MTGLSLAYNLQEHNITIFDKSWRPGGRVSTRNHNNYFFDHGAHYLSTNHSVNQLNEVISKYNLGQKIEIDFAIDYLKNKKTRKKIIIGQNGMNSIPKSIFDNIKLINWGEIPNFDVIINATSIGLNHEDKLNLDLTKIGKNKLFYDVIYNPSEKSFLNTGKKLGNKYENGKLMFVYQAFSAFKLWHGREPTINNETMKLLNR